MGRVLLVGRLAARDLWRRPAEAVLLLLAITAATTTLTLGLVLRDVARDPYQRTREATAGPDVVATLPADSSFPPDPGRLDSLTQAPGVAAHSGPFPVTGATLETAGQLATAQVEGRDPAQAAVDQPALTDGRWLEAGGGAVVEAGFADALGLRPGDEITLNGRPFEVIGVAVTAATAPYPSLVAPGTSENPLQYCALPSPSPCDELRQALGGPDPALEAALHRIDGEHPGLVWLTRADARALAPDEGSLNYVLNLELDDPADATAFVEAELGTNFLARESSTNDVRHRRAVLGADP